MPRAPLDDRFAHFCRTSEPAALGEVFDGTARELLHVAVWLAGNRTDAEDLLQRTFLAAIETRARFSQGERVLPWLLGLLANEARHLRRERARKTAGTAPLPSPAPEDVAAARELDAVVRAVATELGDPYRDVLRLHLEQGLNAREIAERLHRPAGTVRTQLMRALESLRRRLPSGFVVGLAPVPLPLQALNGVREVVVAAATHAVGVAAATVASPVATLTATGGMTMTKKVAALAALALLFSGGAVASWLLAPEAKPVAAREEATLASLPIAARQAPASERRTVVVEPVAASNPSTGSIAVRAVWSRTSLQAGELAAGVGVAVVRDGGCVSLHELLAVTDAQGQCRFDGLAPGGYLVSGAFGSRGQATVVAGETATVDLKERSAAVLRGKVIDEDERPVAGADIWLSEEYSWFRGYVVARSDGQGRFAVAAARYHQIGARKSGHVPSYWRDINTDAGVWRDEDLTLQLRGSAGTVRGRVVDEGGQPIAGARVLIGGENANQAPGNRGLQEMRPRGSTVVSGEDGMFEQDDVGPGPTDLRAWAEGRAPMSAGVIVVAGAVANTELVLRPASMLCGTVRDAAGKPLAGVAVAIGRSDAFVHVETKSGLDGNYRLTNLPAGPVDVTAASSEELKDHARVELTEASTATWDPVLGAGRVLRGVVIDDAGRPMAGVSVMPQAWLGGDSRPSQQSDADGRFAFANVRTDVVYVLDVQSGGARLARAAVMPGQDELTIRVTASSLPTATAQMRLLDGAGQPLAATVWAWEHGSNEGVHWKQDRSTGITRSGKLRPGTYRLQVLATEISVPLQEITLQPHEERDLGDVIVPAPARLRLQVRSPSGEPASGWAEVVSASGASCLHNPPAIEQGTVNLTVPPGNWTVIVHGIGPQGHGACAAEPVEVRAGGSHQLQLVLKECRDVPLEIVPHAAALPIGLFPVHVHDAAGHLVRASSVITGRDGRNASVLQLPAGEYEVSARGADGCSGRSRLTVPAAEAVAPLRITLQPHPR